MDTTEMRDRLQQKASEVLYRDKRLLCQWATGVGKSRVVLYFLHEHPESSCLILVPEHNNIENWEEEFSKFSIPMDRVRVACYASFKNFKDTDWDLLVFDEVPHLDTEIRKEIGKYVHGKHILALGAVVSDDEIAALEKLYGQFSRSFIGLKRAISMGLLPTPKVSVIHMKLQNIKKTQWFKGKAYTDKEYYDYLQAQVDAAVQTFNANSSEFNRQRMYRAGNERKRFLGRIKTDMVKKLCDGFEEKGRRFLCFCSSIKQTEDLNKEHSFTSKTPASMKLLEKFNNHTINSLYVVGKLIEGQNLKDIECGIIAQLGGTERITVQACGRIMRSKNPEIYIPVFDDTKDDSFLYGITSNIPEEYISHYNF